MVHLLESLCLDSVFFEVVLTAIETTNSGGDIVTKEKKEASQKNVG